MKPGFTDSLRTRGVAIGVHIVLWVLLYLALSGFRAQPPEYREAEASPTPVQSPVPVAKLDQLFSVAGIANVMPPTNIPSLFFTKYFAPNQGQPSPPPTTTKIALTYEGFYQTADGTPQTMVRLGDAHIVLVFVTIALVVLHVGAALKHQFVDHARASGRMPPFQTPDGEPVAVLDR